MNEPLPQLEALVMAHRYLYYVKCRPVISDYEYDLLEKKARDELPTTSPVHGMGADTEDSYTDDHKSVAKTLTKMFGK